MPKPVPYSSSTAITLESFPPEKRAQAEIALVVCEWRGIFNALQAFSPIRVLVELVYLEERVLRTERQTPGLHRMNAN